jgi:hypothetical protein
MSSNSAPQCRHLTFTFTLYNCDVGIVLLVAPKAAEPHFGHVKFIFSAIVFFSLKPHSYGKPSVLINVFAFQQQSVDIVLACRNRNILQACLLTCKAV